MYEVFGWNYDNLFVLTRDHPVEVTVVGEDDYHQKGTLYYYGNQVPSRIDDGVDNFGRNVIDNKFIALCLTLNLLSLPDEPIVRFKSLHCWKDGEQYLTRVRYNDENITMEIVEAERYFRDMLTAKRGTGHFKE